MKSSKYSFSYATYFFIFLMVVFMATLSTLLVLNFSEDWEFRRFFCDEVSSPNSSSRRITGHVSRDSQPDPESGFVVYNVEYETKRNHWNLYQLSVGSFSLVLDDHRRVLIYNESGISNHNFENKERTYLKPRQSSEPRLRIIGAKPGDTVTVIYDNSQTSSNTNEIQATSVYSGSALNLCHEETSNALTALGGAFAFALISLGLGYIFWKESIRLLKRYKMKM
ncbi:hypothetical protein ND861_09930 [Leptospira sp. 2 VSF19]|uniref:DUF3592 domain-containing protein n=1 Tax=Leptospira soteropolitanensis TaxID=2950025 RepID=A0AAW5VPI1_9LEPT|nr:hypothetical protein [Leptospira soteropolitanensis]MCW7492474.1 hypothetical protein [Leptospira soteropolitanensis]MCW7500524.1 hypothetical protein [Leptospira soteropolitanensis]MCW7522806.1 hypothetical protein [Leptospira soteropolitanensis]MCW7526664.1 hypothetical protein [Leptospira soteropolitanensis]MCW7530494.1 hypothetical protein [Leptospira soteropolitanensis]